MNKTFLCAAIIAAAASAAPSAFAADGRVTLNGSINAVTCTVKGGAGTDGSDNNFTVTMDSAPQSQLAVAGATAGDTPFSVVIGGPGEVGCTNGKVARLEFDAAASPVDTMFGRLRNDSGTAQNVLVGLLDGAGNTIDLRNNANTPTATITGNTATLNFVAQYYTKLVAATAGTVQTFAMYSIEYN